MATSQPVGLLLAFPLQQKTKTNQGLLNLITKEGNILFNDPLNTFYLCGVGHMVKDDSDNQRKPASITGATLYN